ncbi:MAG: sigma-70 family RNA polymerase sigma factor [Planctomycetes bacterium]|nr:sigma-70 family RNA polymerase sigma factor [Planctomycetota bacterium]
MTSASGTSRRPRTADRGPYFVHHRSFEDEGAEQHYAEGGEQSGTERSQYMTDDVTRACARAMHYAGWRISRSTSKAERRHWERTYFAHRDRIVMGNHKLIYRAVGRWMPPSQWSEDMTGDCQVVLIQAVAAYNPWLGIRFSTYAFTCLMRALSRLSQRHATDRLARSLPLEALPDGEPRDALHDEQPAARLQRIDEFLEEDHQLLSSREKLVLMRRFSLDDQAKAGTLEQVGRELGLSKERVRQVQASALSKLRKALLEGVPAS